MSEAQRVSAASEWRSGWTLALTGMLGISLTTLHSGSTGVMMEPLERAFGWSRTEIYLGNSLVSWVPVLLGTLMGLGIDRLGPRRIALAATVLVCGGYALLSRASGNLWQWWALWLPIGVALAAMPAVWLAPVTARFDASRGLAIAVALSGTGLSNFLVPPLTNLLVMHYGWRGGYLGLAAIWAIVVLPMAWLLLRDGGPRPAVRPGEASAPAGPLPGYTAAEGFRAPAFWKLFFGAFCSTAGGVALIMNMVPIMVSTGIDRGTAAWIQGLAGLSTIVGRIFGGWLMDRMSAKHIAAASTVTAVLLPLMLILAPGAVLAAAFGAFAYGFAGGAKMGAIVYLTSRHLGQRAFGTFYATINAFLALGVGTAPLAANYVYDLTRSYTPVMWAAVPVLLLASLIYLSLGRYRDFTGEGKAA